MMTGVLYTEVCDSVTRPSTVPALTAARIEPASAEGGMASKRTVLRPWQDTFTARVTSARSGYTTARMTFVEGAEGDGDGASVRSRIEAIAFMVFPVAYEFY